MLHSRATHPEAEWRGEAVACAAREEPRIRDPGACTRGVVLRWLCRRRPRHLAWLLAALVLASGGSPAVALGQRPSTGRRALAEQRIVYRPPVDAPVIDPFRPPLTPYGPGNRGLEYATVPGTSVHAAADGVVVFAGAVAGGLHVTVLHGDGVRTTYSFLAAIRVGQRQTVKAGDVVGVAAARLHVGARRGDTYIDPASLWGRPVGPPSVHLVPLDGYQPGPTSLTRPRLSANQPPGTSGPDLAGLARGSVPAAARGVGPTPRRVRPP